MYFSAPTIILTAAHCVLDARAFVVTAGAHRHADPEATQQIQVSTEAVLHEEWLRYLIENDLAYIRTVGPFTFNEYVQPIPLATLEPPPGEMVTAVGWGRNDDWNETISDVLNKVDVPVADDLACNSFWGFFYDYDRIVCTDTTGIKTFCVVRKGSVAVMHLYEYAIVL